ncbi:unnamed protein product [Xylocopa violacea]|uniref:Limulus clotting factor C n=1 Tax=Xylocopa violacea TaxID=135666 RepID=A0ABP1NVS5_XYLVO
MKNILITFILTYSLIRRGYTESNKCGIEKFECANGQCIESTLLCDGRADCRDKSDETSAECTKPEITCPDYAFRCSYGACVDGDAACNGVKDCIDNSDETLIRCNTGGSRNTSSPCAKNQFKCNNGQCINEVGVCDGTADCTDSSDETFIQCGSINCPQFSFRCNYGACIDGDLKCNGAINCVDASDEDPALCRANTTPERPIYRPPPTKTTTTTTTPVTPILSTKFCTVPPQPVNGYWKLHKSQCCNTEYDQLCDHCDISQGTRLEPGAYLIYSCNPGYKIRGSQDVFCGLNGKWLNIPVCTEIRCKGLQSASTNAECTYDDEYVSCLNPVLPRTIATLTCRTSYRPDPTLISRSRVRCDKNGQWDPKPIQCIPVCGVPPLNTVPLIVNGTRANISEFSWHATLYKINNSTARKEFICGATIIHERLLITAAHCVYDDNTKKLNHPSNYYIATGNVYRDYDTPFHTPIVKKAKVKNIYIVCTYFGNEGNYAADIAILEITQPFVFSVFLVPICLDFSNNQVILEGGVVGKVAGFGRTAVGSSSFILQAITVPYIPFNQCRSLSAIYETQKYITEDKFCAGYTNGSSVCDGDSGGGLVFQSFSGGPWYLKGIVSVSLSTINTGGTRICDSYSYSLYTQVSNHMSWIQDIILKVETQKPINSCPVIN